MIPILLTFTKVIAWSALVLSVGFSVVGYRVMHTSKVQDEIGIGCLAFGAMLPVAVVSLAWIVATWGGVVVTPEILTLSRTICGMEGAPKPVVPLRANVDVTGRCFRSEATGIMWRDPRTGDSEWVIDLDDAATGGALLPYCGDVQVLVRTDPRGYKAIYLRDDGEAGVRSHTTNVQETLGIALAKVIAARGWKP